jgi:hypothetical protein
MEAYAHMSSSHAYLDKVIALLDESMELLVIGI